MKLTYLACPYSHADAKVRAERFDAVNRAAGKLINEGLIIFSPISHSHPIAEVSNLPLDFVFWDKFCTAYLMASRKVLVLTLPGWKESTGVTAEIDRAITLNIPVGYLPPDFGTD